MVTYVVEKSGKRILVPVIDQATKRMIPIKNDYGEPRRGEFEMHTVDFHIRKKWKSADGEPKFLSDFTTNENTPPEVCAYLEKLRAQKQIETYEEYIERTEPERAKAEKLAASHKAELDAAKAKLSTQDEMIADLNKKLAELRERVSRK